MTVKEDENKEPISSLEDLVALNPVTTVKRRKMKATDDAPVTDIFLDPGLELLVRLRVAQIYGCGWIVQKRAKMPKVEAGTARRNRILKSWKRQATLCSREKAALNMAVALTRNPISVVPDNSIYVVRVFFQKIATASVTLVVLGADNWRYLSDSFTPNSLFSL
jgi:alkylhydroperoxidase family enzyme